MALDDFDGYLQKRREKEAFHRAAVREKREGPRCKKCGYIGHSCICQIKLEEYSELGGPLDAAEFSRNNEIMRLKKLDRDGVLIDTLLKEG